MRHDEWEFLFLCSRSEVGMKIVWFEEKKPKEKNGQEKARKRRKRNLLDNPDNQGRTCLDSVRKGKLRSGSKMRGA